jgi:hypothetical protein
MSTGEQTQASSRATWPRVAIVALHVFALASLFLAIAGAPAWLFPLPLLVVVGSIALAVRDQAYRTPASVSAIVAAIAGALTLL